MAPQYAKDQPQGYNNYLKNIAIVGAGGQAGKWIVETLLKNGKHNLTALTREGSTNTIPSGVTVKKVDYDNHESLVAALKGQDCLVITLGVTAAPGTHNKLVKAAADANLKWIVPNHWGTEPPSEKVGQDIFIGPAKMKERAYMEEQGMSWTGLACGFWYEFSLGGGTWRYGFDIPGRQVLWFDEGEQRLNTTTFPQLGRATASLLSLKILPDDENDKSPCLDQFRNRMAKVSSFTVNQKEMFASLLRVTGTKESDWTFSSRPAKEIYEDGKAKMMSGDQLGFGMLLYSRIFFPEDHPGLMSAYGPLDNEALGLPKEDQDEFTKKAVEIAESEYMVKQYGEHQRTNK